MPATRWPLVARWPAAAACLLQLLLSPSSVRAQIGAVQSLDGEWIRKDSNYDPNDTMRIRVGGGTATILQVPASVSRGFRVGGTIWQGIRSNGSVRVLGSDGQYYDGTLRIEGTDVLHVRVHNSAAGHVQTWKRAGPSIDGEWVRVAIGEQTSDGMRIRVAADQAEIRFLPSSAPRIMRVGTLLWRDIRAGGGVDVMGSDGRYRPARIALVGSGARLRLTGGSTGGPELWVRPDEVSAAQAALGAPAPSAPPPTVTSAPTSATPVPSSPASTPPPVPAPAGSLFHFLRPDSVSHTTFGIFGTNGITADVSGIGRTIVALSRGTGYGATDDLFVIRKDETSPHKFSTFGTLSPSGVLTDRFGVGSNFTALTYADADLGYGPKLFYFLRDSMHNGFSTFGTISVSGAVIDRFGVGFNLVALTYVDANIGYGPRLFYYLRRDPQNGQTTFGTISVAGAVVARFGVGAHLVALDFVADDIGYGPNLFYFLRRDPQSGQTTLGTISVSGAVTDRFSVGHNLAALLFAPPG